MSFHPETEILRLLSPQRGPQPPQIVSCALLQVYRELQNLPQHREATNHYATHKHGVNSDPLYSGAKMSTPVRANACNLWSLTSKQTIPSARHIARSIKIKWLVCLL